MYLDGEVALHKLNGNALSVMVGDLAAGESVTVSFDVQVLDAAAGTTLQNSVDVTGDNGIGTATDDGVTVPEVEPQNPNDATGFYVTKDVDKTVVDVSKDANEESQTATYTIVVGNSGNETWKNVVLKDTLDTSVLTPVLQNNVYVDGVLDSDWSFAGKVFAWNWVILRRGSLIRSCLLFSSKRMLAARPTSTMRPERAIMVTQPESRLKLRS